MTFNFSLPQHNNKYTQDTIRAQNGGAISTPSMYVNGYVHLVINAKKLLSAVKCQRF